MKVLLLSPYHSGSHRHWAEGFQAWSRHDVELSVLPGRYWKWRMHGGALTLARQFLQRERPDLILATDMLDLTTFLALTRRRSSGIPVVVYMHENQLTYPLPADPEDGPMRRQKGERDLHYTFINYASMLAADLVLFNSNYHRKNLIGALPSYLRHFPEYREIDLVRQLEDKCQVLPIGIDIGQLDAERPPTSIPSDPPLIIWNQRWEYDKNPLEFLDTLARVADRGIQFRLALCGEVFQKQPLRMIPAIEYLGDRIIHQGYLDRKKYLKLLWEADLTISTALHEFFGISVVESVCCGVLPLLPNRLSYPELIPGNYHRECLYQDNDDLFNKLVKYLKSPGQHRFLAADLSQELRRFDWEKVAPCYDDCFEGLRAEGF